MTRPASTPSSASMVRLVARREVVTKLQDRTFWITTVIFIGLIAAIVGFQVLLAKSGSSYDIATVGNADATFKQAVQAGAKQQDLTVTFRSYGDAASAEAAVKGDDVDVLVNGDTLVSSSGVDTQLRTVLEAARQAVTQAQQLQASGLDLTKVKEALTVSPYQTRSLDPDADTNLERGIVAIVAVGVVYFMLITSANFVAQGVVEEKSSRVVELLMATVRPWQLLGGKVLGLGILGILQVILIVGIGLVIGLTSGLVTVPASAVSTVVQVVLWFVLGYALFASMFAAGASLVSRQEDLGSAIGAMSLIPVFAFFGGFAVLNAPTGTLATVLSLVPGFSPISMPVRAAMTAVPVWQYAVAVVLQLVAIVLVIRLAGRIYAGAMLRTGGKVKVKDALASARTEG